MAYDGVSPALELRQDDLFDKVKYTGWLVNEYVKDKGMFGEFAPYDFK